MKGHLTLVTGLIVLIINTIIGLVFTPIETTNVIVSDIVIVVYLLLFFGVDYLIDNDAFSIALKFIFGFGALVCFILSYIVQTPLREDYCLIAVIILTGINLLIYATIHFIQSKKY